jgi:hypothetical protein
VTFQTGALSRCNSTIIEIYVDIIRASHGFSRIDMLLLELGDSVIEHMADRLTNNK